MCSPCRPFYVVVAGVGSGTGSAVAHRFATQFPVALLARSQSSLDPVVESIKSTGGDAIGVLADVSSQKSMSQAFKTIKESKLFDGLYLGAAIFNAGSKFVRKPFLELSPEEFENGWEVNG